VAIINENQIKTIFEIDKSGELFRKLVGIFEMDVAQLILDLESALKREDYSNAKKISHSIKSSSLNMGAAELSILASESEKHFDVNKNHDPLVVMEFQKCFQYTVTELNGFLNLCKK